MRRKPIYVFAAVMLLAALAGCGGKNTAASMSLVRAEGIVEVTDDNKNDISIRDELRLYSGYQVRTRQESFAWIDLDAVKLAKLDQQSRVELQKDGKDLEILLRSGSVFFHVTEPLEDDESMTIRTSTMAVGIRGTCGWVDTEGDTARVYILEGRVRCRAGGMDAVSVSAGEMAVLEKDKTTISVRPFAREEIPAFVLDEVGEDEPLLEAVPPEGGGDEPEPPEGGDGPELPKPPAAAGAGGAGEGVTWELSSDGVLTVRGTGPMEDFERGGAPWPTNGQLDIRTVVIEDGVTRIGDHTFYYCPALTRVVIPGSVASIGAEAFWFCSALEQVEFSPGLRKLENSCFQNCSALQDAALPETVTELDKEVFSGCALRSITIPYGVTVIPTNCFAGCEALTSVTIPDTVTKLDMLAFNGCTALEQLTIPEGVTTIGTMCFHACGSLTSITLPRSLTRIDPEAFKDCTALTEVNYAGSENEFRAIDIRDSNDPLLSAILRCNYDG